MPVGYVGTSHMDYITKMSKKYMDGMMRINGRWDVITRLES